MRLSPRAARAIGVALLVASALLAVGLLLIGDGSGDAGDSDGTLPPPATSGEVTLTAVAAAPGATAMSVVDGEVRLTDTDDGIRYTVDASDGTSSGPTPYGALSRLELSEPGADGTSRWVADERQLHRLDPDSGDVVETIALDVPGAITAVGDSAIWLTVSGLPEADASGVVAPRSFVQRVDTRAGEVLTVPLDDVETFRFALGDESAWATVGRTLYRLDATTTEVTGEVELPEPAAALEVVDGVVVAAVVGDVASLARFDARTLEPRETIEIGAGRVGEAAVVETSEGAELWVLRPDDGRITRVDPTAASASASTTAVDVEAPRRIEVGRDGTVWLLSGADDGRLYRIDR